MSLAKPMMRGLLASGSVPPADRIRFVFCSCDCIQVHSDRTPKQAYADFYKQYDSVKEFNAMREAGVFQSVRPSGE